MKKIINKFKSIKFPFFNRFKKNVSVHNNNITASEELAEEVKVDIFTGSIEEVRKKLENKEIDSEEAQKLIYDIQLQNSQYIKVSIKKILSLFNISISDELLFSNVAQDGILGTKFVIDIMKKAGISAEVRRVNLLDVNSGYAIILLNHSKNVVFLDNDKIYDPVEGKAVDYSIDDIIDDYTGYTIFFYEANLSVSSFIKKTGFLFKSLNKFKIMFLEIIIVSIFINLFTLLYPFFSMNVYDRVVPNNSLSTLFALSTGMILVYCFDLVFKIVKHYITDYVSHSIGRETEAEMLNRFINYKAPGLPLTFGNKMSMFKEINLVKDFYFVRFIPALIDLPFVFLFIVLLFYISPLIASVPLVAGFIMFMLNVLMQVPLQNRHSSMLQGDHSKQSLLHELIMGISTIKIFNAFGKKISKWNRVVDNSDQNSFRYNLWINIAANISMTIMNITSILVMIAGVYEITSIHITTGALIAISTISSRIMQNILSFSSLVVRYRSIQNTLKSLDRVMQLPQETVADTTSGYHSKKIDGKIEFKDINFFYPSMRRAVLNKCSFTINPKDKVAIIGKTGAGKSTIAQLLLGMDLYNSGSIYIDNIDVNYIHAIDIRRSIGFIPQQSFFFKGSLKDNIMISSVDVSQEQYENACKIAGIDIIIQQSSQGDDMLIEEGGSNLSGGQKQIVALARAVLNNPPIILMDEPTNGMDSGLEKVFMDNIKKYVKDKTFILITHKATQLAIVDTIMLLDQGRIVINDKRDKVLSMLMNSNQSSSAASKQEV